MRSVNKIFKRFYHPGYGSYNLKKLCIPYCPQNTVSKYYKSVWEIKYKKFN